MKKLFIGTTVIFVWFMAALTLLPLTGFTAEPGAAADSVAGYMETAKAVMLWVRDNQELIVGFVMAVLAIYGGIQRVRVGATAAALDHTTGAIEQAEPVHSDQGQVKTIVKDQMPALGWLARRALQTSVKKLD